jgi:hypothetical protein
VLAQTKAPAVAVVSIQYASNGLGRLVIDRDGQVESKQLLIYDDVDSPLVTQIESRATILRRIVTQLYQEGYELKASLMHKRLDELIFVKQK